MKIKNILTIFGELNRKSKVKEGFIVFIIYEFLKCMKQIGDVALSN